jgi:cysteinyl-tRNA synthetase
VPDNQLEVFNTMGRRRDVFTPREPGKVSMYTCGPTVYKHAHIGNFRTNLMSDFWIRALEYLGYEVTQVRNITDVGHLVDDADTGEDKVDAAARAEGKAPEEIADFYTRAFMDDSALLNIRPADHSPRATEFVPQMTELISKLVEKGHAYVVDGNVYYDVRSKPDYPKLSGNTLEQLQSGYRMDVDPLKRHPADFSLWKAAGPRRLQIWDSPWGKGYPGWHIECSAMSLHYFPQGFDIHTGGVDLVFPHHEDEIAQSEPVAGEGFVHYWIHGEFLEFRGKKMAKSTGNILRVPELKEMGYDPLAFRYLYLLAKYRAKLSFSDESLDAAAAGLRSIRERASELPPAEEPKSSEANRLEGEFKAALRDDLNLPRMPGLIQAVLKADIPGGEKRALLERWDDVLQLDLTRADETEVPAEVQELVERREVARAERQWEAADRLRDEIAAKGWSVEDTAAGPKLRPR